MSSSNAYKKVRAGDIIMTQGEDGHNAFIIEEGRVEISVQTNNGKTQIVGTRGAGTVIGEMAIVDDEPRTATVKAIEDCTLLEITREDFSRRLDSGDPVIKMVAHVIMKRYRDMLTRAHILNDASTNTNIEELERSALEESSAGETIKIANDLNAALSNPGELYLNYQPIIDLQTGQVSGFEALMRWNHPDRGFISPAIFIPIAEDTGLIVDASRWALKEACAALSRIQETTNADINLFMAVNFSSHDFAQSRFLDDIQDALDETNITPEKLHLEITERLLITQPENAKKTLENARDAGLKIAIDDFGTGFSSLSYLHYFPIDKLKIDQSFIRNMREDENAKALVSSIIALAKNMKMTTVAEGVEDKEEALEVRAMGCNEAQGFYFAKPMSEDDIISYLQNPENSKLLN